MRGFLTVLCMVLAAAMPAGPAPASDHIADVPGQTGPIAIDLGAGEMLALTGRATGVYIANPDIADVELRTPMLVYLYGRNAGETTLTVIGENEEVLFSRRILVEHNTVRLRELIGQIHPQAQVELASIRQSLVITGAVTSAEMAEDIMGLARAVIGEEGLILNHMSTSAPNQVNLRVRIAEVSRETTKRLGVSWDILRNVGDFAFGLSTGGFVTGGVDGANLLSLARDGTGFDVNALIDALDDEGLITVLAEPNLTAMSGESARFLAGGEFPIPVPNEDGITIVFREFGVGLSFLPVVLDDGRLHIKVDTQVSQLSNTGAVELAGFSIPALTVRQATTTINLSSGQSFAIAGLLQNTINQEVSGVTGLADLPILGPLFRSTDFENDETELVVIVTPYVVRPTSGELATPLDGFRPPADGDRVTTAATHTPQIPDQTVGPLNPDGSAGLEGEGGFILR